MVESGFSSGESGPKRTFSRDRLAAEGDISLLGGRSGTSGVLNLSILRLKN
jgi:hypothetical protein